MVLEVQASQFLTKTANSHYRPYLIMYLQVAFSHPSRKISTIPRFHIAGRLICTR